VTTYEEETMSISQSVATSFKAELFAGIHNFDPLDGDTFMLALYTSAADLGPATEEYDPFEEITGIGYTAGGQELVATMPAMGGTSGFTGFNSVVWPLATITAAGALIYNASKSNRAVCVLDFGGDKTSTNDDFTVAMPADTQTEALLRIVTP
jgi:hypothetical protein